MEKINLTVSEKTQEIIIREGEALPPVEPERIREYGNIQSPARFYAIRKGDPQKALVTFSMSSMSILYYANPEDPFAPIISGKLLLNKDLDQFHINENGYEHGMQNLAKILKMNRVLFKERDKLDELVLKLVSFKGTITTELEKSNDGRGNSKDLTDRKTTTSMPEDFILTMPVFVGGPVKSFRVEIGITASDATARVFLISPELQEIIMTEREKLINAELEKFKGLIIIEQQ